MLLDFARNLWVWGRRFYDKHSLIGFWKTSVQFLKDSFSFFRNLVLVNVSILMQTTSYLSDLRRIVSVSARDAFRVSKKNRNVYFLVTYFVVTLTLCPYLDNLFRYSLNNDPFFFMYFSVFGILFNLWNSRRCGDYSFIDLSSFSKQNLRESYSFYTSIALENLRKLNLFLKNVTYPWILKVLRMLYKYCLSFFVFWSPLFKRSSYLSFYKSFVARFWK